MGIRLCSTRSLKASNVILNSAAREFLRLVIMLHRQPVPAIQPESILEVIGQKAVLVLWPIEANVLRHVGLRVTESNLIRILGHIRCSIASVSIVQWGLSLSEGRESNGV